MSNNDQGEGQFRRIIVLIFETICLALVAVPTVVGLVTTIMMLFLPADSTFSRFYEVGLTAVATLIIFIVTSFLAGGALTLLEIAHNTREAVELLRMDNRSGNQVMT
jgi:ACR3 family arsenite efflux pump ArsB